MISDTHLNKIIGLGQGLTLVFFSISGMKCINRYNCKKNTECCSNNNNSNCNDTEFKCSLANMNLGLSTMGATGLLMSYKYLFN